MKPLYSKLKQLLPALAKAANRILESWEQDDEGFSEDFGGGGICDEINRSLDLIINEAGVMTIEGGHEGDDHAYLVVYSDDEAYGVDIPPSVYETGGGYSWKKIPDAVIKPSDIVISEMPRSWLDLADD